MTSFMIGPMCVTEDDFKHQLKKNGLKFGYIKRLYEKWKDNDLTYFRVIIEGCPFVICTDDENSYPEIEEETGKKIEEYSLEWLENLFYQSTIVGPISYESLMPQLQMYIRVKKAEQFNEKIKQHKCQYCHEETKQVCGFEKFGDEFYIARIMPDGNMKKEKAKFCPICSRKLEAK